MNAEDKICRAYFELKERRLYFNQIKEKTKMSNSSLQNVLGRMVKEGRLIIDKKLSNVFYEINDKKWFSLKFSEIALSKFKDLKLNIKMPLKSFLKEIPRDVYTIILFGSTSRGEESKESDIDLLVVSKSELNLGKSKKEAEIISKYPLSIFYSSINNFIKNEDDVVIQAKKTGFPIYKEQNFYEVLLNEHR